MTETYVLYVDHQGHPAPLTECYHATASRRLSSSVDRSPPSTITEVDSAYCPQCLSAHDAPSATRLLFCPKATCQRCPLCQSVASVSASEGLCFYRCGLCEWTSQQCNLALNLKQNDDGSVDRLELARVAEDLHIELKRRREEPNTALENYFRNITEYWEQKGAAENPLLGRRNQPSAASSDPLEGWSVESLEISLASKKEKLMGAEQAPPMIEGLQIERLSLDDDEAQSTVDASTLARIPPLSYQLQSLCHPKLPLSVQDLLPLPIPLRPRRSRRCRAELAEGRPGILLKPKFNPLEGDSSQRTGHGQWWKKDSSAIQVVPHIRVIKSIKVDKKSCLLLKVTNPTLSSVRLRFAASSYVGEPDWDNADTKNLILPDLLVDSLAQKKVTAELRPEILNDFQPTSFVELLPAEDSVIELGGKMIAIPKEVLAWEPTNVDDTAKDRIRLIAQSASIAWFELYLPNYDGSTVTAVPLALEIEVGNGSWESSLIQPRAISDSKPDKVTLDLVLVQ